MVSKLSEAWFKPRNWFERCFSYAVILGILLVAGLAGIVGVWIFLVCVARLVLPDSMSMQTVQIALGGILGGAALLWFCVWESRELKLTRAFRELRREIPEPSSLQVIVGSMILALVIGVIGSIVNPNAEPTDYRPRQQQSNEDLRKARLESEQKAIDSFVETVERQKDLEWKDRQERR